MRKQTCFKALLALCGGAFIASACVNDDYDLSDIDKTVKIGSGTFSLPMSSTEDIQLKNLFSLTDGGAIKEKNETYYLHTGGSASKQTIEIGEIKFDAPKIGGFKEELDREDLLGAGAHAFRAAVKRVSPADIPQDVINQALAAAKEASFTYPFLQKVSLEFKDDQTGEVTDEIMEIKDISFNDGQSVEFHIDVLSSEEMRIKSLFFESLSFHLPQGVEISHATYRDVDSEVTIKADGSDARYKPNENGKQVFEFFKSGGGEPEKKYEIGDETKKASVTLYLDGAYIAENTLFGWSKEKGQKGVVTMNKNEINVLGEIMVQGDENLDLKTNPSSTELQELADLYDPLTTDVEKMITEMAAVFFPHKITFEGEGSFAPVQMGIATFTGAVERVIDHIDDIDLNKDDLPEFLREDDVKLDLANPQLFLRLYSNLGTEAVIPDVKLEAKKAGKAIAPIVIGDIDYDSSKGPFVLWIAEDVSKEAAWPKYADFQDELDRKFEGVNYTETKQAELSKFLVDVPEKISIYRGDGEDLIVQLPHCEDLRTGTNYEVEIDYMINCPLTFGDDFEIVYRDTETGLDLGSDLDKIEVGSLIITATVESKIPLDIKLDLTPLDKNGNNLTGLQIVKEYQRADGSYVIASPELTVRANATGTAPQDNIAIVIRSADGKGLNQYLKEGPNQLDGFRYSARLVNEHSSTEALKTTTYLTLTNVQISIDGGVTLEDK